MDGHQILLQYFTTIISYQASGLIFTLIYLISLHQLTNRNISNIKFTKLEADYI